MSVENRHGKNKPNIRIFAENDMEDGFNSDGLDCESGGQKKTVKVGTRGSMLALAQTELVIKALKERFPQIDFQMITMSTRGDRDTSRALLEFGGKAVFVEEFEEAILNSDIDIAVHSAKDMPMEIMEGLTISGTLPRACPQDVLIYKSGRSFDRNDSFVVGTSSLRRQYQIRDMYPNAVCKNLRGNVGTRIQKLDDDEYDAIILAAAGLERLGVIEDKGNDSTECFEVHKDELTFRYISTESMLPADTQLTCERAVLNRLNAGCHEPIGVYSELDGDHMKLSLMKADAVASYKEKDKEVQIQRKTVEGNTADWEQLVEALIK